MGWTPEQKKAITENGNLLVSAAAGSGKTAVLTSRIVKLIYEGASADDFLVVTFTKAAAAEMKKRIESALYDAALSQAEEKAAQRLTECAQSISRSNISTMHSFCARVLRRHFHAAGIDPSFRVADDTEASILRSDILETLINDRYEDAENTVFIQLSECLGGDKALIETAEQLYAFMSSQPEPKKWLHDAVERYNISEDELTVSDAVEEILSYAKTQLTAALDSYCAVRDNMAKDYPELAAFMDDESMRLRSLLLCSSYAELSAAIFEFKFEKLTGFPRGTPDEVKMPLKAVRDRGVKPLLKQLSALLASPLKKEAERLCEYYPLMLELYSFMNDFISRYSEAKADASIVDYPDMEHMTLKLFASPQIAAEYRDKFKYIFVDEYQDSNLVQEQILSAIKRKDNLFLVGDVKQSIYGFRLAEPQLFMDKYDLYADGTSGKRIDLNANFRSSASVIDTVNELFSIIMHRNTCSIEYDSTVALKTGLDSVSPGNVELHIIDCGGSEPEAADTDDESADNAVYALTHAEAEARVAASRIREIMSNQKYSDPKTGELRPYSYSDFAILHHSPRNVARHWAETLALEGIPALAELGGGYFDAIEVQVFMNLLRVIDNRRQDIPLISVLRSPIGGFSNEELIFLYSRHKAETVLDSMLLAKEEDTGLGLKCRRMLDSLEKWQYESQLLDLCAFIDMLMHDTLFYDYVSALCGGEARRSNLDALILRAQAFDQSGIRSLSSFIEFMDKANKFGVSSSIQKGNADVVSIFSIHKSKGLEFPVVILAGLGAKFNLGDTRSVLLTDSDLGLGVRLTRDSKRFETFYRKAISIRLLNKNIAEKMRVLYVAMTRAREQLIMIGALNKFQRFIDGLAPILTPARAMKARSFFDWVLYLKTKPVLHSSPQAVLSASALDESLYLRFAALSAISTPNHENSPFEWSYPYSAATLIPAKLSVSKLADNTAELRSIPKFMIASEESGMSAAERGTSTHALMQHISIKKHTLSSVDEALKSLVESGHMSSAQADMVDKRAIVRFFSSDLGVRLCGSPRVERELKFNHRISASSVIADAPENEKILLQGMIDCCFIEDGQWVLLDYKTDYIVDPSNKEKAALAHQAQLSLYAGALFALTKIPVREKYICFLRISNGNILL